ncbi:MAG TPA: hypothetical protein VD794_04305, partial [Flavisolibacter sp.]|nr:hypothetical protein [Flavisolibacter sp.]
LVGIALVIAIPIAAFAVDKWLESFTYRTAVHWWVFAIAGVITLLIALSTICLQAIKTAIASPVKNLRTD